MCDFQPGRGFGGTSADRIDENASPIPGVRGTQARTRSGGGYGYFLKVPVPPHLHGEQTKNLSSERPALDAPARHPGRRGG